MEWVFGGRMPFHTNQFGLGKRHWDLETSSAVVEFPPPYRTYYTKNNTINGNKIPNQQQYDTNKIPFLQQYQTNNILVSALDKLYCIDVDQWISTQTALHDSDLLFDSRGTKFHGQPRWYESSGGGNCDIPMSCSRSAEASTDVVEGRSSASCFGRSIQRPRIWGPRNQGTAVGKLRIYAQGNSLGIVEI